MFAVTTFYKFNPIAEEKLEMLRNSLLEKGAEMSISGLLLIGTEGCNATIAGIRESLDAFKLYLQSLPEIGELIFKDSLCEKQPFRRYKVDIRSEIVTLKDKTAVPESPINNHLSPAAWQAVLDSGEHFTLIDTRNFYETEVGIFEGAVDLKLKKFSEFPERIREMNLPKDSKVLMYCTGGIRCEKAILEMQKQGFQNVFQLEGGILKYLEELPNQSFKGECFVFDHRVAVDQNLQPSQRYTFCPHCGNPADQTISCKLCEHQAVVCKSCLQSQHLHTCSKNCAHHYNRKFANIVSGDSRAAT